MAKAVMSLVGKPVNVGGGGDPTGNQRAEERLRDAAERAGFRQVVFE